MTGIFRLTSAAVLADRFQLCKTYPHVKKSNTKPAYNLPTPTLQWRAVLQPDPQRELGLLPHQRSGRSGSSPAAGWPVKCSIVMVLNIASQLALLQGHWNQPSKGYSHKLGHNILLPVRNAYLMLACALIFLTNDNIHYAL